MVKSLKGIFRGYFDLLVEVERESFTVSQILPAVKLLHHNIILAEVELDNPDEFCKQLYENLKGNATYLLQTYSYPKVDEKLIISTALDPRYKLAWCSGKIYK